MEGFDWTAFQTAMGDRNWPYIAACVILLLVRFAKLPLVGAYWDKIPKQYRPLVPVAMGIMSGVGEAVVLHRPWLPALLFGLFSGLTAIGVDQAITKPLAKPAGAVPPAGPTASDEGTKT